MDASLFYVYSSMGLQCHMEIVPVVLTAYLEGQEYEAFFSLIILQYKEAETSN